MFWMGIKYMKQDYCSIKNAALPYDRSGVSSSILILGYCVCGALPSNPCASVDSLQSPTTFQNHVSGWTDCFRLHLGLNDGVYSGLRKAVYPVLLFAIAQYTHADTKLLMRNIMALPLPCTTTLPIGLKDSFPIHELLMTLCNPIRFAPVCLTQSIPLCTKPLRKAYAF